MNSASPRLAETADPAASPRAREILDRCRDVFVAKGFEGASMKDLAGAAGMSAGNFYRYFSSKDAIIEAMVAHDLTEVDGAMRVVLGAGDPRETLLAALAERIDDAACRSDGAIWAEIEAAAIRRPAVRQSLERLEATIARSITRVFARMSGLPEAEAHSRFQAHAQLLIVIVKGATVQLGRGHEDAADHAELRRLVLRTVGQLLDDVATTARKTTE
ncbi:TetR family transcriptional regulator [Wenxinia marina]|uniref:TetR/AcrR family transcriptional regulator n=1 Tax=Wenxinia marina TaxID=390641 RepID=UPI0003A089A8|nr:TetR/AcrR family transcriptional regulator [Wenxinia marina]GGL70067.1 TetR family transcriptional regulator [Wenxinia marina]